MTVDECEELNRKLSQINQELQRISAAEVELAQGGAAMQSNQIFDLLQQQREELNRRSEDVQRQLRQSGCA